MGLTLKQKAKKGLILKPNTKSVYIGYKEPLRPVINGHGFQGVISTNKKKTHIQCHIDGYYFKHLGIHVAKYHNISSNEYRERFGLSKQTSLTSTKLREKLVDVAHNMPDNIKKQRLEALARGRANQHKADRTLYTKSLEQKNREGRCPDQLIDKIHQLHAKLGHTPTAREFRLHYRGMLGSIYLAFGTWRNAVKVAGLMPAHVGLHARYNKEVLIKLLRDFNDRHGRRPSFSDMRNDYMPSQWTFTKYFGSWSNALKEAYE
jgi:hypothetical protein